VSEEQSNLPKVRKKVWLSRAWNSGIITRVCLGITTCEGMPHGSVRLAEAR